MPILIFFLSCLQAFATPDSEMIRDLKNQPCAVAEPVPVVSKTGVCKEEDKTPKEIFNYTKKENDRVQRELAMFKIINERQEYESTPPTCLSVAECTSSIKAIKNEIAESQQQIQKYGPGRQDAVKDLKKIETLLGKKRSPKTVIKLSPMTLELLGQASKFYHDSSADALLVENTNPLDHPEAVTGARKILEEFSKRNLNMSEYEKTVAQGKTKIDSMTAQLKQHQKNQYRTAADLAREEAKWSKYLEVHAPPEGFPNCGLTIAERAAIYWYTSLGSSEVNPQLWNHKEKEWAPYLQVMESGLKKLRQVDTPIYRGAKTMPEDVLKQYEPGLPPVDAAAYTSTSVDKGNAFMGNYRFEINSKTARWIAPFSAYPKELEVLVPAGTKFKVREKKGTSYILDEIRP